MAKFHKKFTQSQILEMRRAYIDGESVSSLAQRFDTSRQTINNYSNSTIGNKNKKTWKEMRAMRQQEIEHEAEYEEMVEEEEERIIKASEKELLIPKEERKRIKSIKATIKEVKRRMDGKVSAKDYIALSKYKNDLEEQITNRNKVYIIGAPKVSDEELQKIYDEI